VINRIVLVVLATTFVSAPVAAQFSSDFPGVPRASISIRGSTQSRTAFTLSGYKISDGSPTGDTLAGGLRFAFGQSYRIQDALEMGFDFTLLDGLAVVPPTGAGTSTAAQSTNNRYLRGLTGYALRLGAKFRPISALDPDGNGFELAFGGAFQPQLRPLYGMEAQGDSSRAGGQFSPAQSTTPSAVFKQNPFARLDASTMLAGMGSFRSHRLLADVAIVGETGPVASATADPSPLTRYSGVSARVGGVFRLTPGIAVGGSYWGNGSPPWSDQLRFATPGKVKSEQYGFLLQLGSTPESGWDLMLTSPTGKFAESARLYIRHRATD
jgi:hypothetical protein